MMEEWESRVYRSIDGVTYDCGECQTDLNDTSIAFLAEGELITLTNCEYFEGFIHLGVKSATVNKHFFPNIVENTLKKYLLEQLKSLHVLPHHRSEFFSVIFNRHKEKIE
jgi:hypothetical protein